MMIFNMWPEYNQMNDRDKGPICGKKMITSILDKYQNDMVKMESALTDMWLIEDIGIRLLHKS